MDLSSNCINNTTGMLAIFLSALKHKVYEMIYNICFVWKWINKFTNIEFDNVVRMLTLSYNVHVDYEGINVHIYDYVLSIIDSSINKENILYKFVIKTIPQRCRNLCYVINIDTDSLTETIMNKYTVHGCIIQDGEDILVVSHKPFGPDLIELGSMLTMNGEKRYVPNRISKYINSPDVYYYDVLKNKLVDKVELNSTNKYHMEFIKKYTSFVPNRKYFIDDDYLYRCSSITLDIQNFYKYE